MRNRTTSATKLLPLLLAISAAAPASSVAAQAPGPGIPGGLMDSSRVVTVHGQAESQTVAPGSEMPVAVVFDMQPGWHIQTNDPIVPPELGDASYYIKTAISPVDGSTKGLIAHTAHVQWPPVHMAKVAFLGVPVEFGVFDGEAVAFLPVTVGESVSGDATLHLAVTYQACDDTSCLAPVVDQPVTVAFSVAAGAPAPVAGGLFAAFDPSVWEAARTDAGAASVVNFDLFALQFGLDASGAVGLGLLLLVAALGGLLLNFTPCVLPLLPIKIMGLQQAAGTRRRGLVLGTIMSLGVVAFWLALGGLIAGVSGFTAANQLFQYPAFTIGVGLIILVMAIGMMGRFSVALPQAVYAVNPVRDTYQGSFLFGILIAVLSTPCTAPFMGAAAAWATAQGPVLTLATFAAIGLGMALPYFVLSAVPELVRRLPRTGPASQLIKEVMAIFMIGAAAYFLGVGLSGLLVTPPAPPSRLYWWPVAFFVAAGAVWMAWRAWQLRGPGIGRWVFTGLGGAIVAAALYGAVVFTDQGPIGWVYYTPDRFDEALAGNNIVVMEFTAEWCLNCRALEESVLKNASIVELLGSPDVVPIKVDLTGNNPVGNEMLDRVGRRTIPLLIVFSPDGSRIFEGDFYTVEQIKAAVAEARRAALAAGS